MDVVAIAGLILAAASLAIAYFAHPLVIDRIRRRRNSGLSKLARRAFLDESGQVEARTISLRDVIYDSQHSERIAEIVQRRYGSREDLVEKLRDDADCTFFPTPPFCDDVKREDVDYISIIASIIVEFSFHGRLLFNVGSREAAEVAIREGYFINLSKRVERPGHAVYELLRLCRIENEILPTDLWSEARDAYFVGRSLPHRHVFPNPAERLGRLDIRVMCEAAIRLSEAVSGYVISAVEPSRQWRSTASVLTIKLRELTQKLLDEAAGPVDRSELISHFEAILSYSHKVIFGDSAMDEKAIVPEQVYMDIRRIWEDSSPSLMAAATLPEALRKSVADAP